MRIKCTKRNFKRSLPKSAVSSGDRIRAWCARCETHHEFRILYDPRGRSA